MFNEQNEILDQKTSSVGIISLRKDRIITFEPKKGTHTHTLEAMKYELNVFKEWAGDDKLGFISDNRTLKKFDSDVRVYAQQHLPLFCSRFALIISSGASSFLTNMFIYINRPEIPIKAFTTKEAALNWLKQND